MSREIKLADGKYTVYREPNYQIKALRYGEPWRDKDLIGDNLVSAMFDRILELESRVVKLPELLVDAPTPSLDYHDVLQALDTAGVRYE